MIKDEQLRIEELARKIAANGASYVDRHQRALNRARVILEEKLLALLKTHGSPLYEWECGEAVAPTDARRRLCTATHDYVATGEGVTRQFMATLAHNDVEFRRRLAVWVGPHAANAAKIGIGTEKLTPDGNLFVSPSLLASFDEADHGSMPAFSYFDQIEAIYA